MKFIPVIFAITTLVLPLMVMADSKHNDESPEEHAKHAHETDGHGHEGHNHEHDDKPQHGGILTVADGKHYELVANANTLALYAEGLPHGEERKSVKIRLTLLQGKDRRHVELSPSKEDEQLFETSPGQQLKPGDKVVALIRTAKAKPRLVKFNISGK